MKKVIVVLSAVFAAAVLPAKTHSLTKLWETPASLKVPESVLFDAARGVLYVSNIDGEPWKDDGQGSIGKVGIDGKVIAAEWGTGLSAPKGLALKGNLLYVGDRDRFVVVDGEKGAIFEKIAVAGAHNLNDVTIDADGVVYVSDSKDQKIYAIKQRKPSVAVEGLKGVNGVHVSQGTLYFLDNGSLYRLGKNQEKTLVSTGKPGVGDGLETVAAGEYVVSYWPGVIEYVAADGSRETLLDTSAEKISSADIGYDPKKRVVYVPTFFKNSVVAYELK